MLTVDEANEFIEDFLPLDYEYKNVAKICVGKQIKHRILIKNVDSEEDVNKWLDEYKLKSQTCWIVSRANFATGSTAKFAFGNLIAIYIL
jgi:hypothetical protein